jgi:transposase-like protein
MSRPTGYLPEFAEQAKKQCEEGATDQELADFFEVSARTLYRWKNTYPEFCQSLKASKEPADFRVERSLYERATGYERDEIDIRVVNGEIIQTPIRKFYPPDTVACIFWLKNRKQAEWRDKTDVEHSGSVTIQATKHDESL